MNTILEKELKKALFPNGTPNNARVIFVNKDENNIEFNKTYYLKYVIKNKKDSYEFSALGSELIFAFDSIKNIFIENGWYENNTSGNLYLDIRQEANSFLEILACEKIYPKKYKKLLLNMPVELRSFVESTDEANLFHKKMILLSKLYCVANSSDEMKTNNLVTITDTPFTNFYKNNIKNNWRDQAITKRMGFKTFEEFCSFMKNGLLEHTFSNVTAD